MRFRGVDSSESITVKPSAWALPRKRIYVSTLGCHLTPDEARRVAKALIRYATAAEATARIEKTATAAAESRKETKQ